MLSRHVETYGDAIARAIEERRDEQALAMREYERTELLKGLAERTAKLTAHLDNLEKRLIETGIITAREAEDIRRRSRSSYWG